jgi:hypothetical protein
VLRRELAAALRRYRPFEDDCEDDHGTNIQIAELNALNAVFAVIKWKKECGFYADLEPRAPRRLHHRQQLPGR